MYICTDLFTCLCICTYICMCTCIHTHIHAYTYIYVHRYTCLYMWISMYIGIYIYTHIHLTIFVSIKYKQNQLDALRAEETLTWWSIWLACTQRTRKQNVFTCKWKNMIATQCNASKMLFLNNNHVISPCDVLSKVVWALSLHALSLLS